MFFEYLLDIDDHFIHMTFSGTQTTICDSTTLKGYLKTLSQNIYVFISFNKQFALFNQKITVLLVFLQYKSVPYIFFLITISNVLRILKINIFLIGVKRLEII